MRSVKGRVRPSGTWRFVVMVSSGVLLGGCAAVTQDVDAYYRQMAVNYKEAIDDAKVEELKLEKKAQIYAVTKDQKELRRTERTLARVRSIEERYTREQERFDKAAKWMESHLDSVKKGAPEASGAADASQDARP
jgi:acyl-[acyl carrier protein]--UDP-N-acetylglucosamine O-acyltransferase